ncbi:MAG: ABC transporter substrate-binding protein [Lachnospiraceae bacterium]|nr:ABC transporter substrate-binding protein [Lachnospiraceae bacterium]
MKKKLASIVLMLAISVGILGCTSTSDSGEKAQGTTAEVASETVTEAESSKEGSAQAEEGATKIIIDNEGNEVEIPTQIDRIVVTAWQIPAPLTVYLGSAEKIVGIAPQSMAAAENSVLSVVYPEILNASTAFYDGSNLNIEELLKLDPDIVIGPTGDMAQSIRDLGIPVVSISTSRWGGDVVTTTEEWLKLFEDIFGENEIAEKVQEYNKKVQAEIEKRVSGLSEDEIKKVMFLFNYGEETISTPANGHFGQAWSNYAGAHHAAAEIEGTGQATINMEQIYEWNPDVVLITNFNSAQPEDLYNNTIGNYDWSSINAVQNKEVYKMPLGWYRSYTPGIDVGVTMQWIAKTIYPDLFADVDIEEVTKEYFSSCFGIELTDEQIEKIFNPPSAASAY